ncbi:type I-B CRISPR-associated protein Cas7/Cst2/DevR [Thermococcus sibiricus]|uniref:CRISPR-associated negative autoregulator, DevR family n=1 Tax=Thermococcus sibiricus TaxID=172049 RepID=A0A101EKT6_9EURY|nr:type I-B CRISPR-associated protein Cas7/Cst2/DevR [Thermococcus sibiricus]KUK16984.1 MAG: CRISPR-associated negative autoregulator, DevR family [Thermococcus sibiricus]
MGRFLVMDVVFYGSSLNYDQGSGNYQELKKITRWDGRQYTLVSRYALRYSLLETGRKLGLWEVAEGEKLHRAGSGDNTVIQPATDLLLTGDILLYPEFDLFGYLITSTTPQNFRSAPAKLSHAISMTPFNYDALFNANLGMANRIRKVYGEMKPNPFTAEEHETFYLYSLVIDLDEVGKLDVFLTLGSDITLGRDENGKEIKAKIEDVVSEGNRVKFILKDGKSKEELVQSEKVTLDTFEKINNKLVHIRYSLSPEEQRKRIENLIKGVLSLKRSIKGREEDLRPRLLVLGIYKDKPYQTFKDKIQLVDEYTEEEYDEIERETKDGKEVIRVKHRISKSRKPVFTISGLQEAEIKELSESEVLGLVNKLFDTEDKLEEVKVFKDTSVEVRPK